MSTMLTDPKQIEHFRMIVLWRGLGLELHGMKMSRGVSCYKTLKGMGMALRRLGHLGKGSK